MHIPSSMLHGQVCPVTLTVGAVGIGLAIYQARRQEQKPSAARFASVTALVFALQMLNYPVLNGTSGHLVGAMLAMSFLGIPFAVLSITVVLAVQAFLFGDGGVNALGANIINMAFFGAAFAGFIFNRLTQKGLSRSLALGISSWASVVIAAIACSVEVSLAGVVSFNKVLPAMLSVHMLIGLGEGLLTVFVVSVLGAYGRIWKANERVFTAGSFGLATVAAMLSPLASNFPDGLEWVASKLSFKEFSGWNLSVIFPDYQATFITSSYYSTVTAAFIGVSAVYILTFFVGQALEKQRSISAR